MAKVIHLSIARKSTPVLMDVVQGATAPDIQFILDDYMPPEGSSARIYIKKTDTEVYNDCTLDGNIVTYKPTTHSFDEKGQCVAQLQITEQEAVAVSFRIFVTVEPNYIDEESIEAQSEYSALSGIIQSVNGLSAEVNRIDSVTTARIDNLMQAGTETKSATRTVASSKYSTETLRWGSSSKTVYKFEDSFTMSIDGQTLTGYEVVEVAYTLTKEGTTTQRVSGLEYDVDANGQISVTAHDVMANTEDPATYTTTLYVTVAVPGISIDADAELLDVRVGYDGTTYRTAGGAVREQVSALNDRENAYLMDVNNLIEMPKMFWLENGEITIEANATTQNNCLTNLLPTKYGAVYEYELLYASEQDAWLACAMFDENLNFISRPRIISSGVYGTKFTGKFTVNEENAKYISFAYRTWKTETTYSFSLKTNADILYENTTLERLNNVTGYYEKLAEKVGFYLNSNGGVSADSSANVYLKSVFTNNTYINYGDKIRISLNYGEPKLMWLCYGLWDENFTFLGRFVLVNGVIQSSYENEITIDNPNAKIIRFSYRTFQEETTYDFKFYRYGYCDLNDEKVEAEVSRIDGLIDAIELNVAEIERNYNVKSINHRGFNNIAPENTLPAYRLSKRNGFKYVEADVSLTSDGVPVLLHDNTINRTARNVDGTAISSTINIADITYAEALTYDFGIWKSDVYAGTKIPTFEEFISLCRKLSLHPYIELKPSGNYTIEQVSDLVDIVKSYGMENDCTWISFNATYLEYVKTYDPEARLGFVKSSISSADITTVTALKTGNNEVFYNITINYASMSDAVSLCKAAGLPLEVWAGDTTATVINSLNGYISGITCNNLVAGDVLLDSNIGDEKGLV